jgi:CRP-like cAMP-binding protein
MQAIEESLMLELTSEPVRSALIKFGTTVAKEAGAVLFEQGKPSTGIYLILNGKVQTCVRSAGELMPRTATVGTILGIPATINGECYSISAIVQEDAELIHVSREQLLRAMRSDSAVALSIVDLLSKEVREIREELKKPQIPGSRKSLLVH